MSLRAELIAWPCATAVLPQLTGQGSRGVGNQRAGFWGGRGWSGQRGFWVTLWNCSIPMPSHEQAATLHWCPAAWSGNAGFLLRPLCSLIALAAVLLFTKVSILPGERQLSGFHSCFLERFLLGPPKEWTMCGSWHLCYFICCLCPQ